MSGVRGQKSNKATQVPERYTENFLADMDRRTKVARALRDRAHELAGDLGGWSELSYQRRSLLKRAIHMEAHIEAKEQALARGEDVDLGKLAQAVNTLMGLLRTLGLDRRTRDVPDLHTYLAAREEEPDR